MFSVRCFLLALLLCALCVSPASASNVKTWLLQPFTQTLSTNPFVATAISTNIQSNGGVIQTGIPKTFTPFADGYATNYFNIGWYSIQDKVTGARFVIQITDSTTAQTDWTNCLRSGFNTYANVITYIYTNGSGSVTLAAVTNALGFLPADSRSLTNISLQASNNVTASIAVATNAVQTSLTNLVTDATNRLQTIITNGFIADSNNVTASIAVATNAVQTIITNGMTAGSNNVTAAVLLVTNNLQTIITNGFTAGSNNVTASIALATNRVQTIITNGMTAGSNNVTASIAVATNAVQTIITNGMTAGSNNVTASITVATNAVQTMITNGMTAGSNNVTASIAIATNSVQTIITNGMTAGSNNVTTLRTQYLATGLALTNQLLYYQLSTGRDTNWLIGFAAGTAGANSTNYWNGAGAWTNILAANSFVTNVPGPVILTFTAGLVTYSNATGYVVGQTNYPFGSGSAPGVQYYFPTNGLVAGAGITFSSAQGITTITATGGTAASTNLVAAAFGTATFTNMLGNAAGLTNLPTTGINNFTNAVTNLAMGIPLLTNNWSVAGNLAIARGNVNGQFTTNLIGYTGGGGTEDAPLFLSIHRQPALELGIFQPASGQTAASYAPNFLLNPSDATANNSGTYPLFPNRIGFVNIASIGQWGSSILGGQSNVVWASDNSGLIADGSAAQAYSDSTILGGFGNSITNAALSVAGGLYATVRPGHHGSFVWADASSASRFSTTSSNQFLIRATNGVGINTNNPGTFSLSVQGTIGQNGTNLNSLYDPTNAAGAAANSATNYANTVGTGGTNYANLVGQALTNNVNTAQVNHTNLATALSNNLSTINSALLSTGLSLTNRQSFDESIAARDTNTAYLTGWGNGTINATYRWSTPAQAFTNATTPAANNGITNNIAYASGIAVYVWPNYFTGTAVATNSASGLGLVSYATNLFAGANGISVTKLDGLTTISSATPGNIVTNGYNGGLLTINTNVNVTGTNTAAQFNGSALGLTNLTTPGAHRVFYMAPAGNNATGLPDNTNFPFASFYPTNTSPATLATNGDIIYLRPGTYLLTNYLALNKGVTLEGAGRGDSLLLVTNYSGGGNEISILQAADNQTYKNFGWSVTNILGGAGGAGYASFMFSQLGGFTNVTVQNCNLGGIYQPVDIFIAYSGSSTTNTDYQATIQNCYLTGPWDLANFVGASGRYQITSRDNTWVALNTTNLSRIFWSVNPGSIFTDSGSRFFNFGGTNTANISQQWWAGNVNLHAAKFYASTNQFPLKSGTSKVYPNVAGDYYDAVANIPYSWNADRSYYLPGTVQTNGCLLTNTPSFGLFGGNIPNSNHNFTNQVLPGSYSAYGKWIANDGSGAFCVFNDPTDPNFDGFPNFYIYDSATNMLVDSAVPPIGLLPFVLSDPIGSSTPPNNLVSNPTNYFNLAPNITYKLATLDGGVVKNTNTIEITTNLIVDGPITTGTNRSPGTWNANPTNAYVITTIYTNANQQSWLEGSAYLPASGTLTFYHTNFSDGRVQIKQWAAGAGVVSAEYADIAIRTYPSNTFQWLAAGGAYITNLVNKP